MSKLRSYGIAIIRTSIVPPTVGLVLTWLAKNNVTISSTWASSALTVLFSGIWYIVFHGIEILARKPWVRKWAGIFLGFPSPPKYPKPVGPQEPLVEGIDYTYDAIADILGVDKSTIANVYWLHHLDAMDVYFKDKTSARINGMDFYNWKHKPVVIDEVGPPITPEQIAYLQHKHVVEE